MKSQYLTNFEIIGRVIILATHHTHVKMPHTPPDIKKILSSQDMMSHLLSDEITRYAQEFNKEYLHWNEVIYRDTGSTNPELIWTMMKISRDISAQKINLADLTIKYNLPDKFMHELHEIDVKSSSDLIEMIDEKRRAAYSVSSVMEESIASSQIEGATTTTKVAKAMLVRISIRGISQNK